MVLLLVGICIGVFTYYLLTDNTNKDLTNEFVKLNDKLTANNTISEVSKSLTEKGVDIKEYERFIYLKHTIKK
jgi:hypothetical protein